MGYTSNQRHLQSVEAHKKLKEAAEKAFAGGVVPVKRKMRL